MNPGRPPTEFEERVYTAVVQIPFGKVTTYRDLAKHLDCGSAQAIGQALKRNPFAPEVPCHRVVKSDRSIGGFHGETEGPHLVKKQRLLLEEGVEFSEEGKVEEAYCYQFPEGLYER